MQEIYAPLLRTGNPVITMDAKSAEMSKYAANAFLAMKISYANMLANICEKIGADYEMVRKGMCSDGRIGKKFLFAGLGYGGSCFPKDVRALMNIGHGFGCDCGLLSATDDLNRVQRKLFVDKIREKFGTRLSGRVFGVWGLSFKPETNDMREAPSIDIINALLDMGATVKAFDPEAFDSAREIFGDKIEYSATALKAIENADAMLLLTEWLEFRSPNFATMAQIMKGKLIFDGRNQYNHALLGEFGLEYHCIGRGQKN
jgi:UDPglucose 6-dehydrogenase